MKIQNAILILLTLSIGIISCKSTHKAPKIDLQAKGDNSMTSVDWPGTYQGIFPCADCEGIQTQITLNNDLSYILETRYNGKDEKIFKTKGAFKWDANGSKITLDNSENQMYQVGENQLFQLDKNGNRITGDSADNYTIKKEKIEITGKHWTLIELKGLPVKIENREPFIKFNNGENSVNGNNSCNTFSGKYEISDGNKINFSPFMMTRMACVDNKIEAEFMSVLEAATSYSLAENNLVLSDSENNELAKFQADFFK